MRVGLHALGIGVGARPEIIHAVAVAADEHGFATLWAGEHVVMVDSPASRYPYSADGLTWERGECAIDGAGYGGEGLDAVHAEDMSLIEIGNGTYRMYYAACDKDGNWRIASAVRTSPTMARGMPMRRALMPLYRVARCSRRLYRVRCSQ